MKVLPSFFMENLDLNNLEKVVITNYICATGVTTYDFKVNLFVQAPMTVFSVYLMGMSA